MDNDAAALDLAICRLYDLGYAQADVARAVSRSSGRVRQILDRHDVPKRSACIPALVWEGWPKSVPVPGSGES